MKRVVVPVLFLALLLVTSGTAVSQGVTNSAMRGHVINEGQGLPGVSVEVKSPTLQGSRNTVTSANGDFSFSALPPGNYTVTFTLAGFETVTKPISLSTAQVSTVDASLKLSGVTAEATVTASVVDTVSTTTQASTTITQDLTRKLPISRSLVSQVDLSSGITRTGPGGNITISGAQSFDNVFTVDGAVIQDNVRATPNNLFIEDAIQETTTSVTAISAEFGRFTGGVVNTVTKSGGNTFQGSFRTTLTNDAWTAISPKNEVRNQKVNPRYEATLGGFLWKDHVWFFGSGRLEKREGSNQTVFTNIPFGTSNDEKRYSGKLTLTPVQNHSLTASYLKISQDEGGNFFGNILDLDSLVNRSLPQETLSLNYNGVIASNFFIEGLYSRRKFTFENSGSTFTDLIKGTLMRDISRGNARYNAPTFCGVCSPEKRDNRDYLIKGTYFLSTEKLGSHNIVLGYDNFAGQRTANNYQSGSNYRLFTTSSIFQNGDIFPVINNGQSSYIYYTPIDTLSQGTNTLTHSVFLNDQWRLSNRLSFNLGVRFDKNNANDSRGVVTANDSAFSPRLAAAFDVKGDGSLKVAASYAKYIGGIQDNLVDSASNAGAPSTYIWYYEGPKINVGATSATTNLVSRGAALQQVFDWFFAQNCPNLQTCQLPLAYASAAGVSRQIRDTLKSPGANEFTIGVNGTLGTHAAFRMDFVRRKFTDFYNTVLNTSTGRATDPLGNSFDLGIVGNTNNLDRNYTALQTQFSYHLPGFFAGANWTWSHTLGNIDGETATGGPVAGAVDVYPEYKQAAWNSPYGSLASDQRHRVRVFATYDLPILPARIGVISLGLLQVYESGSPYGAVGAVRASTFVTNPGYLTRPATSTYYYTARDAFHTDDIKRTDLNINISTKIANFIEIFVQPQVTNVFNNQAVIGVDTTIRTNVTAPTVFTAFNPFTTTPVQGTNWDVARLPDGSPTSFGKPRNSADYQAPRTFLLTMGLRF
ncbi:MAG: carboxypeptidase regulatory-like domain-containing protein [Thermoanaerobaculia bacterium]